jgi:hypothetical protein
MQDLFGRLRRILGVELFDFVASPSTTDCRAID